MTPLVLRTVTATGTYPVSANVDVVLVDDAGTPGDVVLLAPDVAQAKGTFWGVKHRRTNGDVSVSFSPSSCDTLSTIQLGRASSDESYRPFVRFLSDGLSWSVI